MSLCGAFIDGVSEGRQGPDELFESRCAVLGYGESLRGELGDDTLRGADGADVLDGGQGTDLLFGEQGVDVLMDPGGVDDQLTGGADGDFLCSKGAGAVLFGPDPAFGNEANLIFASASGGAPGVSRPGGAGSTCGSPVWGSVWSGGLACTVNTVAFCAGY